MPTISLRALLVLHSFYLQLGRIISTPTNQKTHRYKSKRAFGIFTSVTEPHATPGSFGNGKQDPICMEVGTDEF
jgi:hypothetical protein